MWKLAAVLYLLVGPTVAGAAVLVGLTAPSLDMNSMEGIAQLGLGGLAAGAPLSFIAAAIIGGGRRGAV